MVSFSTTGLLLPVALFPLGTTHDCAIGQAGPSIWSRLAPATLPRCSCAGSGSRSFSALSMLSDGIHTSLCSLKQRRHPVCSPRRTSPSTPCLWTWFTAHARRWPSRSWGPTCRVRLRWRLGAHWASLGQVHGQNTAKRRHVAHDHMADAVSIAPAARVSLGLTRADADGWARGSSDVAVVEEQAKLVGAGRG